MSQEGKKIIEPFPKEKLIQTLQTSTNLDLLIHAATQLEAKGVSKLSNSGGTEASVTQLRTILNAIAELRVTTTSYQELYFELITKQLPNYFDLRERVMRTEVFKTHLALLTLSNESKYMPHEIVDSLKILKESGRSWDFDVDLCIGSIRTAVRIGTTRPIDYEAFKKAVEAIPDIFELRLRVYYAIFKHIWNGNEKTHKDAEPSSEILGEEKWIQYLARYEPRE